MSASDNELQLRVVQYLYGGLTDSERDAFERDLQTDPQLARVLEQEQRLDSVVPRLTRPHIDDDRMQGNRFMLRQALQKSARRRSMLSDWVSDIRNNPQRLVFQLGAMAATFVLGLMVSTQSPVVQEPVSLPEVAAVPVQFSPLSFVQDEDYEIYQMKVNSYDPASGEIDLSFSLASETRVSGNIANSEIHSLMAVALQEDIDSASRLDTINVLQPVASGDRVYEALIHVLLNDQNPGVRYQAVQSLVQLVHEDEVRNALRFALADDVNSGVRIEAFKALMDYRDDETLSVFRDKMENDSNEFIRTQARAILEETDEAQAVEL